MYGYIRVIIPGPMPYVEFIKIMPDGSVPPRPTPGPDPEPPLGIWGPDDPRPSNPIQLPPWVGKPQPPWPDRPDGIWGPTDPRPSNPIQLPPWVGKPQPPFPPSTGQSFAVVKAVPPGMLPDPPPTPPEGSPEGTQLMMIWFGPGTLPTVAWVPPYADASPPKPETPPTAPPAA